MSVLIAIALLALSVVAADARPECLSRNAARRELLGGDLHYVVRSGKKCWRAYKTRTDPLPPMAAAVPVEPAPAEPLPAAEAADLAALAAGLEKAAAEKALTMLAMDNSSDGAAAGQFRAEVVRSKWRVVGAVLALMGLMTIIFAYFFTREQPGRAI